jgi:hypothetical protein
VLELRLRQMYDHCATLGLRADEQYSLVVVDISAAGRTDAWLADVLAAITSPDSARSG